MSDIIEAHKYCRNNRENITKSNKCGCFCCLKIFKTSEITEWIDRSNIGNDTALCPYCGTDSVLPEISGYPITKSFLNKMETYWFSTIP